GNIALYGDRWLTRGIAALVVEGPGQSEAAVLGIPVTMQGWLDAGPAIMNWLAQRPEVDSQKVGITGSSLGSFFGTLACAAGARYRACAVVSTCLEPGHHTIFQEASPTFKQRFMWMSGYADEAEFDEFRKTLTWEGHIGRIRVPYLCVAGEADELSPL